MGGVGRHDGVARVVSGLDVGAVMADVLGRWRRLPWDRLRAPSWILLALLSAWSVRSSQQTADRASDTAAEAHATAEQVAELVAELEQVRIDRCVAGRGDTRAAIVRVVDDFTRLPPSEVARLAEVVEDEIPTAACTTPP